MERIDTEILIIGSGAAGLRAAIEAGGFGSSVTVVSKGRIGRSGNTVLAQCNLAAFGLSQSEEDSQKSYILDMLEGGSGINQRDLIKIMAEESGREIVKLKDLGVEFLMDNKKFLLHQAPGHSFPRIVRTDLLNLPPKIHGLTITKPLIREAEKQGMRFIEGVTITELIRENDICKGALGIVNKTGKPFFISAKSIVIASGGGGRVFKHTNNSIDITGDSYALALNAGASLIDMEFVQFYPTMAMRPLRIPIVSTLLGSGAILKNSHGERFMEKYSPKKEMATRDVTSRAIFKEIASGRGIDGAVYLDCSRVPKDIIDKKFPDTRDLFKRFRLDIQKDPISVCPITHFFMGGIKINDNCETDIKGLFACGEAAGGIHGANRISGNALTETLVFGAKAGRAAFEYSDSLEKYKPLSSLSRFQFKKNSISKEGLYFLREMMWRDTSIIRSKSSLNRAGEMIHELKNKYEIDTSSSYVARGDNEIRNMVLVSEAIIHASLLREESRGAHFREDIPGQRQDCEGNFLITRKEGILKGFFLKIKHEEK